MTEVDLKLRRNMSEYSSPDLIVAIVVKIHCAEKRLILFDDGSLLPSQQ